MTVYIVMSRIDSDIYEVFDTQEKAEQYTHEYHKNHPEALPLMFDDFYILEKEVQ